MLLIVRAGMSSYLHSEKRQNQFIELPIIHMGGKLKQKHILNYTPIIVIHHCTNIIENNHVK